MTSLCVSGSSEEEASQRRKQDKETIRWAAAFCLRNSERFTPARPFSACILAFTSNKSDFVRMQHHSTCCASRLHHVPQLLDSCAHHKLKFCSVTQCTTVAPSHSAVFSLPVRCVTESQCFDASTGYHIPSINEDVPEQPSSRWKKCHAYRLIITKLHLSMQKLRHHFQQTSCIM